MNDWNRFLWTLRTAIEFKRRLWGNGWSLWRCWQMAANAAQDQELWGYKDQPWDSPAVAVDNELDSWEPA